MKRKYANPIYRYLAAMVLMLTLICSCEKEVELVAPQLATERVTIVSSSEATITSKIIKQGSSPITEQGVCYGTAPFATEKVKASTFSEEYDVQLSGLNRATLYYVRAYAVTELGTEYGAERVFTTSAVLPSVTTMEPGVHYTTITMSGKVESDGGAPITESGFVWSTSENPEREGENSFFAAVALEGADFELVQDGLDPLTTYYIRAYAINSIGISYGVQREITTAKRPTPIFDMPYTQDFSTGATEFPVEGWDVIDYNADGRNWYYYEFSDGTPTACSRSYDGEPVEPYNFLLSPGIQVSGNTPNLKWQISVNSSSYPGEKYKVILSSEPITKENCTNESVVTTLFEETCTSAEYDWADRIVSLQPYIGQTVYLAWVHYDCYDMSRLYLGNIVIDNKGLPSDITPVEMPLIADFGDGTTFPMEGWELLDHDGDGFNWAYYKSIEGIPALTSRSYDSDAGALTPYNFLITPPVNISGSNPTAIFKITVNSRTYCEEKYKFVVSEEPFTNQNCETATVLYEEVCTPAHYDGWIQRDIDLSAYVGKTLYMAWVHYGCTDLSRMYIGDIRIENIVPAMTLPYKEDFASGDAIFTNGWSLLDKDADGFNWGYYKVIEGIPALTSRSYDSDAGALTPYNFVISPKIALSGEKPVLSWQVTVNNSTYCQEKYKVVLSEEPLTLENCTNDDVVTVLFEEVCTPAHYDGWIKNQVDLSAYSGKKVYIAWVHYDCTDLSRMYLGDIQIANQQ